MPGLSRAVLVEGTFKPLLLVEIAFRKHHRHQVALFHADAVFAGQHAADLDAQPQDICAERFRTIEFARLVGIVEDQGMQIAVPGMENIGDAQIVLRGQFLHAAQHQRQLRARDGAVHAIVIWRDASNRREGRLAAGPEQEPLFLAVGSPAGHRPAFARDRQNPIQQMIDLGVRTVQLDDQQCLDVERIAGVNEFLRGVDRRPVHHLHAGGDDAGADDARNTFAAVLRGGKADEGCARALRLLQNAHRHLGDNAQQALRAGNDAQEIVAGGIQVAAAKAHDLAVHQHQFAAKHVVGGDAVFEAVHAAGIFRDIAADGAGNLR